MSADNGFIVIPVHDSETEYGIFHYFASSHYPPEHFVAENCYSYHGERCIFFDPRDAIVFAHLVNKEEYTEYGVSVHELVIAAARQLQKEAKSNN